VGARTPTFSLGAGQNLKIKIKIKKISGPKVGSAHGCWSPAAEIRNLKEDNINTVVRGGSGVFCTALNRKQLF
jgi:hypothetical protein